MLRGFKSRAATEQQRMFDAIDSEYYIVVCFQTREQKDEFLTKTGWDRFSDKYLDGMAVAKKMGVALTSRIPQMPRLHPDTRTALMARDNAD